MVSDRANMFFFILPPKLFSFYFCWQVLNYVKYSFVRKLFSYKKSNTNNVVVIVFLMHFAQKN
jgi:hypothetical protein